MDDLKIIKDKYGEKMMHLCRTLFPTLLEIPGILSKVMLEHFYPSKFLYDDIVKNDMIDDFKNYIYSFVDVETKSVIETSVVDKTPFELLSEAGYDLYECKTEEDIQAFRKYYAPGEKLCTFHGNRLRSCWVFFAVKKNVSEIRRENFPNPKREDEYGTSVISIQFSKGRINTLSIKNRYNHKVNNPDSTFNNNLDNIIPGLTESFRKTYNFNFDNYNTFFELPNYVRSNDGKFYKYNHEINNIYYCTNNIIIDNFRVIDKYSKEPERYIVFDYFILDLKEKKIEIYDKNLKDSFGSEFKNIEKINVLRDKKTGNRTIEIKYDGDKKAIIVVDKTNRLIEYHNNFLELINDNYLENVRNLHQLHIPNVKKIGNKSLKDLYNLTSFDVSNLLEIGDNSLCSLNNITSFSAPNLEKMGDFCLRHVNKLNVFNAPKLVKMGRNCLEVCMELVIYEAPNLIEIGDECFYFIDKISRFSTPKLVKIGNSCFYHYDKLENFEIPNLMFIGRHCFCYGNDKMETDGFNNSILFSIVHAPKVLAYNLNNMIKNALYKLKGSDTSMTEKLDGGRTK